MQGPDTPRELETSSEDRVLEQRIESTSVRERVSGLLEFERLRDEIDQNQEEDGVGEENGDDPGHERAVLGPIEPEARGAVGHQHPEPEQQRAGLPAPERGQAILQGHRPFGVAGDVGELEVVARKGFEEGGMGSTQFNQTQSTLMGGASNTTANLKGKLGSLEVSYRWLTCRRRSIR